MNPVIYKIRNKVTGLWSKGGSYPRWGNPGKTWLTIGQLRTHITSVINSGYSVNFSEWEVISYQVTELDSKPIHEVVTPKRLFQLLKR